MLYFYICEKDLKIEEKKTSGYSNKLFYFNESINENYIQLNPFFPSPQNGSNRSELFFCNLVRNWSL